MSAWSRDACLPQAGIEHGVRIFFALRLALCALRFSINFPALKVPLLLWALGVWVLPEEPPSAVPFPFFSSQLPLGLRLSPHLSPFLQEGGEGPLLEVSSAPLSFSFFLRDPVPFDVSA